MRIRKERASDRAGIARLITAAFDGAPHAGGNEAAIVDCLRAAGALTLSLVAESEGALLGHVAFSPVAIDGVFCDWYGLGPVAVAPAFQRQSIGAELIRHGLAALLAEGAAGCVVLGDPDYYGRFGFGADPALVLPDVPPEYFQALRLDDAERAGEIACHPAFYA